MDTAKKNNTSDLSAPEPMAESAQPEPTPTIPVATPMPAEPNEALFGSILIACLALSLIAATGYFGVAGYRYYQQYQAERAVPSIESLPRAEAPVVAELTPAPAEKPSEGTPPSQEAEQVAKAISISVMNGGAAKGSAGKAAEMLKAAGYQKVSVGNTESDFDGTTVYYAAGQENVAEGIQKILLGSHPTAEVKPAIKEKPETSTSIITVILGKK